jgi:hypothetical protein
MKASPPAPQLLTEERGEAIEIVAGGEIMRPSQWFWSLTRARVTTPSQAVIGNALSISKDNDILGRTLVP